jgi:hypothetical protein
MCGLNMEFAGLLNCEEGPPTIADDQEMDSRPRFDRANQ